MADEADQAQGASGLWARWRRIAGIAKERRLAMRLLWITVSASAGLALLATAVLLAADYRRQMKAIDDGLARMERSALPSVANSLWSFDERSLRLQLEGLLQYNDVRHAVVLASGGERFEAGRPPGGQVLQRDFLLHNDQAGGRSLGRLTVTVSLDAIHSRLVDTTFTILAATLAGTLLVSLIVFSLVNRWVTRHLEHMARHARALGIENLGQPLALRRDAGEKPDELDHVANALNDMARALSEELARRAAINADRARLFNAYERNRALLQAIIDHSPAAIAVKGLDGRYLLVNRRCAERHGIAAEDFVGKTDIDLFPAELAGPLRKSDQRVIASREPMQAEEVIPLAGGPRTVLSAKAPLYNDRGDMYAVCGIYTDITDRKRVEEELGHYRQHLEELVQQRTAELRRANEELVSSNKRLEQAQTQLVQSEKMASIGVLAAGVAHEINNPIGFVGSNLGALSQYVADLLRLVDAYEAAEPALEASAPAQAAAICRLKEAIDLPYLRGDVTDLGRETQDGIARVRKIVQDLKDFSHVGESHWQVSDIHKGIDSTLNIAWNELKYKVEVIKDYGELPEIECLPSELNQVFMNLFVNAAHAIEAKGQLRIRTGRLGHDGVWIEVADTGKGIAPENLQRIFEPFFTTKPVGQGTGLGLALSYSIVQKHHGTLEVESTVGQGTTFRITLPVSQQALQAEAA